MENKDRKAIVIGAGIAVAAVATLIWALLAGAEELDKAILYGQVTDAVTTAPISDINVDCDGYTGKTDSQGNYRIINIEPGTYPVAFMDPYGRYEPLTV